MLQKNHTHVILPPGKLIILLHNKQIICSRSGEKERINEGERGNASEDGDVRERVHHERGHLKEHELSQRILQRYMLVSSL